MDGHEACRLIKADPETNNIPIIMVTALGDREAKLKGLNASANDFLSKPIDQAELTIRVKNLLKIKALEDFMLLHNQILEEEVRQTQLSYRSLFDNMMNGFAYCRMIFDQDLPQDFIYLDVNTAFELQTGLKNVIGKKVSEVIPGIRESDSELFEVYGRVALTGHPERIERYVASLKMWFDISVYSPEKEYFVTVFDVITERKQAEEKILQSLHEKGLLIRELYHRTKNTMQIIQGIIMLQAVNFPTNEELQELVKNTEDRIQAMALVHQMLYKSEDLSHIPIKEYMQELAALILKSYSIAADRIIVKMEIDDQYFLIDTAIPFGLIFNELLTNSLKHAFPDNKKGLISIVMTKEGPDKNIFRYSDNGVGVCDGFDFKNQKALGLQLIHNIGELQMKGKVALKNNNGVSCLLEFPTHLYKARV